MRKSVIGGYIAFLILLTNGSIGFSQVTPASGDAEPQTFAMIIGISNYKFIRPLNYADKDAELFRDFLKSPGGGNLKDENIFFLVNENAKAGNFWVNGMAWLKNKKMKEGDKLFIFMAGHGDAINEDEYFFLTYDCNPAGDKNNYIVTGNIQLYNLKSRIASLTGRGVEVVFIMDACRTNELPGGREGQDALNAAISEKRAGEIIMLATGAGQESLEDASIGAGHGLFTYYLVQGLAGMADSSGDSKVTLNELQNYVHKYVPLIAQEKYKRKQMPYFCCNKDYDKTIVEIDTVFMRKWMQEKRMTGRGPGNSFITKFTTPGPNAIPVREHHKADTTVLEVFNLFKQAIKDSRLTGQRSAEYYYNKMAKNFPGHNFTQEAQSTLTAEYINFAQSKINLYLECKDASTIQKLRAQIDDAEKTEETDATLNRMEIVASKEFYEVGQMLKKAIGFIFDDDSSYARSLEGKMYFFKARGYYGTERRFLGINQAFQFAYVAYANEPNAAYVLNTLASLHIDNNRTDSAIFYAAKAVAMAPQWRYPYVSLAYAYRNQNKIDSALKYYRKAIEVDPSSADAYVDIGHYYYSLSNADSAIFNYQKALRIEPSNVSASNNIGWLYYDRKRFDSAIVYFKRTIAADPGFFNAYNGLARSFFAMKKFDSAKVYYVKAFDHYQDKSFVNLSIGNFFRDLKQYDSAQVYYRHAIQFDPKYEEAYNNLGRLFTSLKLYDSARAAYTKALEVNPFSAFSLINLGVVYRELKQTDSMLRYLQRAFQLEPRNPSVLNYIGVVFGQDNQPDSAKSYFRRALDIKPDHKSSFNNLMKIFKDLQQLDSVTNYIRSSGRQSSNNASLMNELALVFLNQKRLDSSLIYFRRAVQMDPLNASLYNNMSLVFREMRLFDSSRSYLQKAAQLDPDNGSVSVNLANLFRQLRQIDSATYYYKKQLLQRVENNARAYQSVGLFLSDIKAYDSAIVYYKKAIAMDPGLVSAYNNIGAAYMLLDNNDSAFVYYRKAAQLDTTYFSAVLNLGLLYHSLHRYDSAIVYLQKAILLNPTNTRTYYQLATSYSLHNQVEQAVEHLRLAFEKGFKNYDVLINDPDLMNLKDHPGYKSLVDKYILKKDQ
jgi:tetratricopeptide (TPR) repeat protein